ncbi:MAG: MCE family protein [Paucibacter sp.]|nr:MCE family protein [Roseateles sp.]
MENKAHALATGLFVLLLGAALIGVIAWFQGDHHSTHSYTVVARHGVPGLNIKAPVKLSGVVIGKVEDIAFDAADASQVLVSVEVDADAPLKSNTRARLGYQGITGLSFIDLGRDEEQPVGAPLAEGARIELRSSTLDELMGNAPRVLASIDAAARRVAGMLDGDHQQQLFQAVKSIDAAAQSVTRLADDARALQPDARRLMGKAGDTLAHVDAMSEDAQQLAREWRERAAVMDRVGAAADQLQSTAKRLELAIAGPEKGDRKALVEAVNNAADAVARAAKALQEQPQGVLLGAPRPPPGPGEPGFDANRK